jgi:hypothetical protein
MITDELRISLDEARAGAEPVMADDVPNYPICERCRRITDNRTDGMCIVCFNIIEADPLLALTEAELSDDLPVTFKAAPFIYQADPDLTILLDQHSALHAALSEAALWFHHLAEHDGALESCDKFMCQQFAKTLAECTASHHPLPREAGRAKPVQRT